MKKRSQIFTTLNGPNTYVEIRENSEFVFLLKHLVNSSFLAKSEPSLEVMADQSATKQRILSFAKKYKVIDYVIFLSSK